MGNRVRGIVLFIILLCSQSIFAIDTQATDAELSLKIAQDLNLFSTLAQAVSQATDDQIQSSNFLNPYMVTIQPDWAAKVEGPVFMNSKAAKQAYGTEVLKLILKSAHEAGKRYLEYSDYQGYYAWMMLALTVPLHEGMYIHFREAVNEDGTCSDKRNRADNITDARTKRNFINAFFTKDKFLVAKCSDIEKNTRIRQLISGGADGSDIGMMQLNTLWHYEDYISPGTFKSVQNTIQYGMTFLMTGFKPLYANYKNYSCLVDKNGQVNRLNLIRGTWAGKYNSGNLTGTCRFKDPTSTKDKAFMENLNKTLRIITDNQFGFNQNLNFGLDAVSTGAVSEVLSNFDGNTNTRTFLKQIIGE